ncbi:hypothetical protein ACX8XP_11835 [Calditrichota bacterium LG25]
MKFRFYFLLLCIFSLSSALYAGDVDRLEAPAWVYENGFTPTGVSFWASGGAGIANPHEAEVLFYNPASPVKTEYLFLMGGLKYFEKSFFQIQDLETKIGGKWLVPSYLLIGRRLNSGFLFLGFQNVYHFKKKFIFEVVTVEQPEGTGEFLTNIEEQSLQNFFIGFNRSFLTHFNFGLKIGLLRHSLSGEMGHQKIDSKTSTSYALNLGLNYEMNDQLHMALTYRYLDPLKYKFRLEAPMVSDNYDSIEYVMTEIERYFRLPWFLDFGIYLKPAKSLQLMLKLEYQEWKKVSKYYDNRLQLALGATISPDEKWRLNFGAFTSGQYPQKDDGLEDTPFVTAGIDYRLKSGLVFSISALSNTFFVDKVNNNAKQIDRSQIMFGMAWALK